MLGALTSPVGSSIKFSTETFRSGRKMSFVTRKAVICAAAVAEAAQPEVERRRMIRRPAESLYEVLRVKHDASLTEIKTAYRTLAKLYHPDVSAAASSSAAAMEAALDGKEFIEIHEAYATLSDPTARAEYDLALSTSSRARRTGVRYRSPDIRDRAGFYTTRRWETDQCW